MLVVIVHLIWLSLRFQPLSPYCLRFATTSKINIIFLFFVLYFILIIGDIETNSGLFVYGV